MAARRRAPAKPRATTSRRRADAPPAAPKLPYRITRAAVMLDGGPRHRACYYADDWDRQQRAAERMGQPPSGYERTEDLVPHPVTQDMVRVWRWQSSGRMS